MIPRIPSPSEIAAVVFPPIKTPDPLACDCCGGSGWIGGPSFYQPDEGGYPCPDCEARLEAEHGICAQDGDE